MSYLLQSQIQIQRQNALNTSLSAQIAQNSSVAERSDNAAETVPAETIDFVSTSLPTPVSQSSNEVAEDHKVSTGSICPSTDIESPQNHADSISQHSKFSTKLPANLIKTSTWTAETARRSRSPARMPNGTSASDWLFAHPASGTSVALLSSLIAPKSAQSKSNPQYPNHSDILKPAVTATMHAPSQSRQDVQAPQLVIPPATSMPERGSRGRNAIDEQFIAVDRFTPLTSSIASKATHRSKADKTNDATYDAFYNLTQLKPSTKGSPLTLKESPAQETPSMLFPRTNAPTPYAPTQLTDCNVPRAGAGPANSYLSPRISPQEVHTRLFYSADS